MKKERKHNKDRGFTLFIAMVTVSTLIVITGSIINFAVRQNMISQAGRESQYAFYAADTGMECALYWDVANPSGASAFSTSTVSSIDCNNQVINNMGGADTSTFTIDFLPDPFCVTVTVTKTQNPDPQPESTVIESRGYNTCDLDNARRVERAVRASY